jgi:hypothetical protein
MLKRLHKVLLLGALLAAFAASSIPAFGNSGGCVCFNIAVSTRGSCHFDKKTSQCINTSCNGECVLF